MRKLTLTITISLVVSILTTPASAAGTYNGGTGDPCDPFQINTPAHLDEAGDHPEDWNKHFILTADIDMTAYSYTTAVIAPDTSTDIAFQGITFTGSFDGAGFVISNLTIDTVGAGRDNLGLFGYIRYDGEVKNLGVENVNITGVRSVGGLCGYSRGTITNCYATGAVTGYKELGGLCGSNGPDGTITNCYATSSVTGGASSDYLGGLCGKNSGTITNCHATGSVTGGGESSYDLGGLCGRNDSGTITNCYAIGAVTSGDSSYHLGGLCGRNQEGTITNCYAIGSVTSGDYSEYLSGLCGANRSGDITNCYAIGAVTGGYGSEHLGGLCGYNDYYNSTITNCYATGSVTGDDELGGLCGSNGHDGTITNCYATGSVTGDDELGGLCGKNYYGTITNCYATGSVTGDNCLGGLCGRNDSGTITNCFWDIETGGPDNSIGTPKTTTEMQTRSTFTDASWDFVGEDINGTDDFWRMCVDDIEYSKLSWQFLAGDFACPDGVNLIDFAVLADTWYLSSGQAGYNDLCDLMDDDTIDLHDLAAFAENWLSK